MKQMFTGFIVALALAGCQPAMPDQNINTITVASSQDFNATEASLIDALASRNLKLFTVVDHGAGATSVGEDIGQSKLFIFGNPKVGTPIMAEAPALGLELPMKILINNSGGSVQLHRPDVAARFRAYGAVNQDARLAKVDQTLTAIMTEAAGK